MRTFGLWLVLAVAAWGQGRGRMVSEPLAHDAGEKRILAVMDGIVKAHKNYLSVPLVDGMALRVLTEAAGAKQVVEIGTSTGYSGLWFCLALRGTGGHLTTFELDAGRAATAAGHFREAGVEKMVTIVQGDAHANVAKLKAPVDVVFIDADKDGYLDYLKKVLPLVRPGGLILAHNVEMAREYVDAIKRDAALETVFFMEGGGLGITVRKR